MGKFRDVVDGEADGNSARGRGWGGKTMPCAAKGVTPLLGGGRRATASATPPRAGGYHFGTTESQFLDGQSGGQDGLMPPTPRLEGILIQKASQS